MTLRDHQPDILFQGDLKARARHRALSEIGFLERNIKTEQRATWQRRTDRARVRIGLDWIKIARARVAQLRRQVGE